VSGLLDELEAAASEPRRPTGRPCSFGAWLATLPPGEADAIRANFGVIKDKRLARIICDNGYEVSETTIANHRRDECLSCRN
jgi:hypothetical protein